MKQKLIRFIFVGFINTLNYYILYLLLLQFVQVPFLISHILATGISMILSYFLNTYFTFQVKPSYKSFLLFPFTQFANILLQSFLLIGFVNYLGVSEKFAPIIALFFTIPITFFLTSKIIRVG